MWPLSSAAQRALTTSHTMTARATAYTPTLGVVTDIPVVSGNIRVDATSQTRRTGTIGIADPAYWPADPLAILSPLGAELLVEYGVVLPGQGIEWIPLIRGVITDAARSTPVRTAREAFTVTLADRSRKVAEAEFEQARQTTVGATAVTEITQLITEVLPVTVTDRTASSEVAAQLTIERARWADGVEKLATAIGAEVFADPLGQFVIRPQPTLTDTPAWHLAGVVVSLDEKMTRDFAFSKVVASGQRTDGTPPVFAAVADTNPLSPTYINGPFGTKVKFYVSPLLTTTEQCTRAAATLLARSTGMSGSITIAAVTNPALDAGDVISVQTSTGITTHIIDTVTIPLSAKDAQRITTRTLDPSPVLQ